MGKRSNNIFKLKIMKTFLSKQKYQVYAIGLIAVYFLTRFLY